VTAAAAARRALAAPAWVAPAALLAAGWLLTFALDPWADERVNDLYVYRGYAEAFLDGFAPYRDVPFEYPPLGALPVAAAGLAGTGEEPYRLAFAALMLACAVAGLLACGRIAGDTGGDRRRALLGFAGLPLAAGAMVRTHFDPLPLALLLGGLACVTARRPAAGLALLATGAMAKGFPLLAAPVALAWLAGRGDRRAAARGGMALAGTLAAIGVVWLAVSPAGASDTVAYHLERPVQVESTPAVVLYALDAAGGDPASPVFSHRSDGLVHAAADGLAAGSTVVLAALLAALCLLAARRPEPRAVVLASLAAVAALAALGKVLSPQFLIWVWPLGALAFAWRLHALAAAVAAATLLTLAEFPARYFDVVAQEPAALALVAGRNAALLAAVALAVRALAQLRPGAAPR
jgi:hypothetical protein